MATRVRPAGRRLSRVSEYVVARRLEKRPGWRQSSDRQAIERMLAFNQWFVDSAEGTDPPMVLLDTTELSVTDVVRRVAAWVRSKL